MPYGQINFVLVRVVGLGRHFEGAKTTFGACSTTTHLHHLYDYHIVL